MILVALFGLAFVTNGVYLILVRLLMSALERESAEYWARIGSPKGFDANSSSALLSHLFRGEMTRNAAESGFGSLLLAVRLAFSLGLIFTLSVMWIIVRYQGSAGIAP
jgi:uncharacterized membrane protein YedE/YeeE